ncbi:hypothetical protein N7492_006631 [Penicillium capsulatum]|uniref:NACHT domain-containing protein n=1 Tax=Penicillium capsulatum TaxID=69766 RepID=A0A9W9LKW2_9EURO|nr:hypothetical protein N7492_006631 [Penicillium capsulatum]KAJ6116466.1 hypothetical protein N7512_006191 [Penicillium capsulatum]
MSKALVSAVRLEAEIRLAQAISEFEVDLSTDQKVDFNANRARAAGDPPTTKDVMQLTAEIDRSLSKKLVGGRCLGTRTTSFLQCVQQFAALGDIVVGGSQNLIACGVWSLVRTSLLVCVVDQTKLQSTYISQLILKFSSYFEKVSSLFMAIGRSAPRYERIGLLYPRSKDPQSSLFEYFIVVVRLCHQMVKFTRKSTLGKLGTTINDPELSSYQSQLETWSQAIKDEMNYLMAQRIEEHADLTTQLWPAKFSKTASRKREMNAYLQAIRFCSTFDHILPWKQARKAGNTRLFHRSPEYLNWKSGDCSRTLILTGRLGSGKTVLLANIVDDLNIEDHSQKVPVAFFFCRHDLPDTLKPQAILGSHVGQLLRPTSGLADYVEKSGLHANNGFTSMQSLLKCCVPAALKGYFVIDGLDECNSVDREVVIRELRQLQEQYKILICATVRQEPKSPFVDGTEWTNLAQTAITAIPDNRQDIEAFIEAELEARIKTGRLITGSPLLILEIQDALVNGSQGMFLWVALQIETLCSMATDEAIRQALADLPRDLSETFARILQRSDNLSLDRSRQRTILQLITAAYRPLRVEELREALSVIPGDPVWDSSRLLNNIFGVLGCCGSLLTLDEEEMTVRLVHSSVKQFLVESSVNDTSLFTLNEAQRTMADVIVTYLNYGVFETQVSTKITPKIQVESAPSAVIRSTLESSGGLRDIALKLLKSRKKPGFDMGKTLAEIRALHPRESQQVFCFLQYARSNCFRHVLQSLGNGMQQNTLLLRLLNGNMLDSASSEDWNHLLFLAAEIGNDEVVKLLVHSGRVNPNTQNSDGRTPLHHAVFCGRETTVALLLEFPAVNPEMRDAEGWTPLNSSIICASDTICKILIESGRADPNAANMSGQTPLHVAAENLGVADMAGMLLQSSDIDPGRLDSSGEAPLYRAVQRENTDVARVLIESGKVDINARTPNSRTALHEAARLSNTGLVKLLLDAAGVAHSTPDATGKTPLHEAAATGAEEIAVLLIDGGGSGVELADEAGLTALHHAATRGAVGVVKRILDCREADPNAKDCMGRTSLHLAFKHGKYTVAKVLIGTKKVSLGAQDHAGRVPFDHSTLRDSRHTFERLLKTQLTKHSSMMELNLNSKFEDGQTLLQRVIASRPNPETLYLLLEIFDVDPECRGNNMQTALHTAAIYQTADPLLLDRYQLDMYETSIEVLLDSGKFDSALDSRDENGLTPLDLAEVYANDQGVWALQASESVLRARERLQGRRGPGRK